MPEMPRLPVDDFSLESDSDWQRVLRSPLLNARFRVWRVKQSALARFADPAGVVRFLRGTGPRAEKDAVLCALLAWAKEEAIGGRVVLEAILPGLLNLSARILRDAQERDELWSTIFLAVWEGIRGYPLARRPRRVAANLLLDTLHRTLDELGRESVWRAMFSADNFDGQVTIEDQLNEGDVDGLLDTAVRAGAVTPDEAETILASRIDGVELADLARAAGVSYNAMKLRRQRAERRLLVFLGYRPVPRGQQNRPFSLARVAGVGPLGPVG
jgi:DNA-directed RNA polymerase specialized sigma24 family protein